MAVRTSQGTLTGDHTHVRTARAGVGDERAHHPRLAAAVHRGFVLSFGVSDCQRRRSDRAAPGCGWCRRGDVPGNRRRPRTACCRTPPDSELVGTQDLTIAPSVSQINSCRHRLAITALLETLGFRGPRVLSQRLLAVSEAFQGRFGFAGQTGPCRSFGDCLQELSRLGRGNVFQHFDGAPLP